MGDAASPTPLAGTGPFIHLAEIEGLAFCQVFAAVQMGDVA